MKKPLSLKIDLAINAGYVVYRALPEGEHTHRNDRVSEDVVADYDVNGQVIGIELLAFDSEALEVARCFAETRDLEFPEILTRAILVPA